MRPFWIKPSRWIENPVLVFGSVGARHLVDQERRAGARRAATSPISRTKSVRSCSGSPESARPEATSTSSFSCIPEGTARLNALTTPSARSISLLDAMLAAHLAEQPCRHARERDAEVEPRADLLDVGRGPARLAGLWSDFLQNALRSIRHSFSGVPETAGIGANPRISARETSSATLAKTLQITHSPQRRQLRAAAVRSRRSSN